MRYILFSYFYSYSSASLIHLCLIFVSFAYYFLITSEEFVSTTGLKVGIVVGILAAIALLLAILLLLMNRKLDLSSLPADVRWFYERYQKSSSEWTKHGK